MSRIGWSILVLLTVLVLCVSGCKNSSNGDTATVHVSGASA